VAQVEADLKKLSQIYGVYSAHAEAVRLYSNQLWSELDVAGMMTATEEVAARLTKLKGVKDLPTYAAVEAEITGFRDSLPLMKELKSEALR
jgi:dynein heavy chain